MLGTFSQVQRNQWLGPGGRCGSPSARLVPRGLVQEVSLFDVYAFETLPPSSSRESTKGVCGRMQEYPQMVMNRSPPCGVGQA